MQIFPLREIANELPFFKTVDDREKLLGVVGALVLRKISLRNGDGITSPSRHIDLGQICSISNHKS
jgi:hypothetical protein